MSSTEPAPSLPLGDEASAVLTEAQGPSKRLDATDDLRARRTRRSVLWAAYGDALGFISEMADERLLRRRTRGKNLDRLIPWMRRVGGRSGVEVELPAGCWSDDTQLRLAVGRSLSGYGFDTEMFANVELPVWPSYALGGGRASKAASKNLANPRVPWYANTFEGWTEAGGNGAAMRIQPHVWASARLSERDYLVPVIEDSVCTHGHPRALVGACFSADLLAHSLIAGEPPDLDTAQDFAEKLEGSSRTIEEHDLLGSFWISLWESATAQSLRDSWDSTVCELVEAVRMARSAMEQADTPDDAYEATCRVLGLREKHHVGSGVLTTVAAAALAAIAEDAYGGCTVAANALGTDTDTIASMAGALLGACDSTEDPPELPLDAALLTAEADRLHALATGEWRPGHTYPDLLRWAAPSTQADALVRDQSGLAVDGLGSVSALDDDIHWSPKRDFAWRWVKTCFNQTLLIKSRPTPPEQAVYNRIPDRGRTADRPDGAGEDQARLNLDGASSEADKQAFKSERPNKPQRVQRELSGSDDGPSSLGSTDGTAATERSANAQSALSHHTDDIRGDRAGRRLPPAEQDSTRMTPEQLKKYAEHARRKVNDDRALVDMLRQVARVGNQADLAYVATNLYDDLRR